MCLCLCVCLWRSSAERANIKLYSTIKIINTHDGVCAPVCAVVLCMKPVEGNSRQTAAQGCPHNEHKNIVCVCQDMVVNSSDMTHGTWTQAVC